MMSQTLLVPWEFIGESNGLWSQIGWEQILGWPFSSHVTLGSPRFAFLICRSADVFSSPCGEDGSDAIETGQEKVLS